MLKYRLQIGILGFLFCGYFYVCTDMVGSLVVLNLCYRVRMFRVSFRLVVLYISQRVFRFSEYYIEGDNYETRFFIFFVTFVGSIVVFLISPDFFFLILGWELLGIRSYLLVRYYQSSYRLYSSILTIFVNRVGDRAILVNICRLLPFFLLFDRGDCLYIKLFLCLGCFVKRAQLPFSVWLPAAMAAPTPVSALVHSSTLVTAGTYLFLEIIYIFDRFDLVVVTLVRLRTIVYASVRAFFEVNLKKVIALSTTRQVRVVFFVARQNLPNIAIMHLLVHAFFKSVLFITTGIGLHRHFGDLDSRYLKFSWLSRPFIMRLLVVSNICLVGFPFSSAFYSKDQGFDYRIGLNWPFHLVSVILLLSIFFSCVYRFKIISNFLSNYLDSIVKRSPLIRKLLLNVLTPLLLVIRGFGVFYGDYVLVGPFYFSLEPLTKVLIFLLVIVPVVLLGFYWGSSYSIISTLIGLNFTLGKLTYLISSMSHNSFFIRIKINPLVGLVNNFKLSLNSLDYGVLTILRGKNFPLLFRQVYLWRLKMNTHRIVALTVTFFYLVLIM